MKKIYHFITLSIGVAMLALLISGCGEKCPNCPEDKELSVELESLIPYQKGDEVKFTNFMGDTIRFVCSNRTYSQEESHALDSPQSYCCPSYFAQNVKCELQDENDNFLNVCTSYLTGTYDISIFVKIPTENKFSSDTYNDASNTLDSVEIGDVLYYNVEESKIIINDNTNSRMYFSLEGKGLVGFIINGEEWALVE